MRGSSEKAARVLFATSNEGKLEEARVILARSGISVEAVSGKGVEIQADTTAEVAAFSSRAAARSLRRPVMVEDAGLFVEALGGFPGVYSAYALRTIGLAGIIALVRGKPRRAAFVSSVAFCEPAGEPRVFEGAARGTIASSPRGSRGFGFDPIFVPEGGRLTFGQLTLEEKCLVSHRAKALGKFAAWFCARDSP